MEADTFDFEIAGNSLLFHKYTFSQTKKIIRQSISRVLYSGSLTHNAKSGTIAIHLGRTSLRGSLRPTSGVERERSVVVQFAKPKPGT